MQLNIFIETARYKFKFNNNNNNNYLIYFSLEQQIYNTIKYTIVTLCNAKHKTQL